MKQCATCGTTKSTDDFHKNSARRDGRHIHCKPCSNAYYRERSAVYRARPDVKARKAEYKAQYYAKNPQAKWEAKFRWRVREFGTPELIQSMESFTRDDVIAKYGDACWHCGTGAFESLDHFPAPVVRGGAHSLENVKPSCFKCQQYSWREGFKPKEKEDMK